MSFFTPPSLVSRIFVLFTSIFLSIPFPWQRVGFGGGGGGGGLVHMTLFRRIRKKITAAENLFYKTYETVKPIYYNFFKQALLLPMTQFVFIYPIAAFG